MIRRDVLEACQRILLAVLVMICLAVVSLGIHAAWKETPSSDGTPLPTLSSATRQVIIPTAAPNMTPLPTNTQRPGETGTVAPARSTRIGIVAGHWKHDSGAVCPDGLQEVDINLDIAHRVVSLLALAGYEQRSWPSSHRNWKDMRPQRWSPFMPTRAVFLRLPGSRWRA